MSRNRPNRNPRCSNNSQGCFGEMRAAQRDARNSVHRSEYGKNCIAAERHISVTAFVGLQSVLLYITRWEVAVSTFTNLAVSGIDAMSCLIFKSRVQLPGCS